ncbi:hypothetical protein ACIPJN_29925 [Streptomyces sp. NPDC086796]|uniref:hypothetical protein n=1 Tax=Streptomyces sp. NPDC086796 TaxID=3365760 RepID=UPI0038199D56
MSPHVWLRLADDRLARAADIQMADLWGPTTGERTPPVKGRQAHVMIRNGTNQTWDEVAACDAEQGGLLVVSLLSTLAAAATGKGDDIRFVYGLYDDGRLLRWTYGSALPLSDIRVPPLHELQDPLPGRWLTSRAAKS